MTLLPGILVCLVSAISVAAEEFKWVHVAPDKPTVLTFPAAQARFVRLRIHESEQGQPCLDELEVYAPAGPQNLALASRGAQASASSCLPGYAVHQVAHLNDGLYGNGHSWIAASTRNEWAQIDLPESTAVAKVVFSRDREGRYRDRLPSQVEVQLSLDGTQWSTACRAGSSLALPATADAGARLRYAFLCEQATWSRIDADAPVTRVLKQTAALIERLAAKGLDVSAERAELTRQHRRLTEVPTDRGAETDAADATEAAYLEARLAKRRLFLRDPELAPLGRVLFVARHPYEPSHNYSDILDAQ